MIFKIIFNVCVMCQLGVKIIVCVCVCAVCQQGMCALPRRPEADIRSPRAGIIGSYDPPSVGTGNQI